MDAQLNGIEAVFLDLDGTIYLGGDLIDGAMDFLARCDQKGVARYFLSNNSSRSVTQYLKKLEGFGIPATAEEILLSTHDLLAWLNKQGVTETWAIGTEGMDGPPAPPQPAALVPDRADSGQTSRAEGRRGPASGRGSRLESPAPGASPWHCYILS